MNIVHLMASPFVGGPERQVLGLAGALRPRCRTVFLSFAEGGRARAFLDRAAADGFESVPLRENAPHVFRAAAEVAEHLRRCRADVLCCNGYKPDLVGWLAARRAGVPAVAIAHGWTAATWKVRVNEALDRLVLHGMDRVVCVSAAQAAKVRRAGVPSERVRVIRNAVATEPFDRPDPAYRAKLHELFVGQTFLSDPAAPVRQECLTYFTPATVVGAAGRLSPEKGFDVFIDAAALVRRERPDAGFVLFGDGPLRERLAKRVAERRLDGAFVLAGFRPDVERFLPFLEVAVLSSHTEGLPVAVLEAMAARVPVVATAVGGTPEVVADGATGRLVPPGDAAALARRVGELLADDAGRRRMGDAGRRRVEDEFTFARMAEQYLEELSVVSGQLSVRRTGRAASDASLTAAN
jgi:glycosyltransferase involved in cell wall biosynthesis